MADDRCGGELTNAEMNDPRVNEIVATTLAEAAAWQARAERMEGSLKKVRGYALKLELEIYGGRPPNAETEVMGPSGRTLSSPRPSPSKLLEVVRAGVRLKDKSHRVVSWNLGEDEQVLDALHDLENAALALTPEELAAILGEEATESSK